MNKKCLAIIKFYIYYPILRKIGVMLGTSCCVLECVCDSVVQETTNVSTIIMNDITVTIRDLDM